MEDARTLARRRERRERREKREKRRRRRKRKMKGTSTNLRGRYNLVLVVYLLVEMGNLGN